MKYQVSAGPLKTLALNQRDTVSSVLQNVAIILSTFQGSVPMMRDFGISKEFIDKPLPVARVMCAAAVEEAIEKGEPRAEIVSITFQVDENSPGKLIPTVEVTIKNE